MEARTHRLCHKAGWMFSGCPSPSKPRFPGLALVGVVRSTTERAGQVEHERRCHLCSVELNADTLARAARNNWDIEDQLY